MSSRNFLETKLATHLKPVFWANDYAGGHGNPSHEHGGAQSPLVGRHQLRAADMRHVAVKKGPISSLGSILAIEKYWALRGSFALLPACARLARVVPALSTSPPGRPLAKHWRASPLYASPLYYPPLYSQSHSTTHYPLSHPACLYTHTCSSWDTLTQ